MDLDLKRQPPVTLPPSTNGHKKGHLTVGKFKVRQGSLLAIVTNPFTWGLLALVAVASMLRLYNLDARPLWLDEASTWQFAHHRLLDILSLTTPLDFTYPPGYNAVMWAWIHIGGDSVWWLRLPAVLFSVGSIALTAHAGKMIRGRLVGLTAGAFLALAPLSIQHAQQVRGYAMISFCIAAVIWCLTWLYTHQYDAINTRRGRWVWSAYTLNCVALLYLHNTNIVLVGATMLAILAFWLSGKRDPLFLRNALVAATSVFLLWLPWIPTLLYQIRVASGVTFASHGFGVTVRNLLIPYAPYVMDSTQRTVVELMVVALAIGGLWGLRNQPRWLALLVGIILVPTLALGVAGVLVQPILQSKLLLWSLAPLSLLVAIGLFELWPGLRIALSFVIALGFTATSFYYLGGEGFYETGYERWPQAADVVAEHAEQGDIILFNAGYSQTPFGYYFDREPWLVNRGRVEKRAEVHDVDWAPLEPGPIDQARLGMLEPGDETSVIELIESHDRVWLVENRAELWDPEGIAWSALTEEAEPQIVFDSGEYADVRVTLFDRTPNDSESEALSEAIELERRWVRGEFERLNVPIATGVETEEDRLERIVSEILGGERDRTGVTRSIANIAGREITE